MPNKYSPQEGDIISINFDPHAGQEPSKVLNALVVSPGQFSQTGFALVVPIVQQATGFPDNIAIPLPTQCKTKGRCLTWQIKSFDFRARSTVFVEKAPAALLRDVRDVIKTFLGP